MTEKKAPSERRGRRATGEQKQAGTSKGTQRDQKSGTFREGKKIKVENVRKDKSG